jgi:hypothetical protein
MESNSQGRKKHMVEGTVQKIARTEEKVEEAAKEAKAELKSAKESKCIFAKIADLFKK